jgi:chromosome segregation ATPase
MNTISSSVKNILQRVAEELEPKSICKIIFPLIDEIEELQSTLQTTLERLDTQKHYYESEAGKLEQKNEHLEKENRGLWSKISTLKTIFESIEEGISLEGLYENITEVGDLLNSDLSKQIELIEKINKRYKETKTIRVEKDEIEIQFGYLQKKNEELKEEINNLVDTKQKLTDDLINQNGKVHMLEEEVDLLKSENERLNNQIIDIQRLNRELQDDIFRRCEND